MYGDSVFGGAYLRLMIHLLRPNSELNPPLLLVLAVLVAPVVMHDPKIPAINALFPVRSQLAPQLPISIQSMKSKQGTSLFCTSWAEERVTAAKRTTAALSCIMITRTCFRKRV